ncbi:ATP-dependent Clp protease ATP-binding subunit ClpA [Neolewinella xylanilytica]|uniref:ATP-dependent Clp protease ATP-binding subunit ClpA n=1 Tax=Neolewinella xylanilytica TaxID=1514080 RepID=A0A2S6IBC7_9BACT|nr:ATP-dependent Clp protease ATP-binding subunit [Neolewinella xylanilytica]PPK88772.1 ATP-dependent Clp protease ATP-binding subunit ClpA [Neolewinella xylanilytica]
MLTLGNYTTDLREANRIAAAIAREYRGSQYGPPHLLKAVLHDDVGLSSMLRTMDVDLNRLREWAEVRLRRYPKSARPATEPTPDDAVERVLSTADIVRLKLSLDRVDSACVLAALCKPGVGFTAEELKSFPLTEQQLLANYVAEVANQPVEKSARNGVASGNGVAAGGKGKQLERFCTDKTAAARAGKIDPIIGRNREIRKIAEILGRRTKPNAIIVGEPGVGKTALVEGFARLIVAGEVPERLREATLWELDTGSLIAGAAYKGEIEERLKSILAEIKARPGTILFIDEIHILLDPQGGAGGAANLLKPELARGELTVIGATTHAEYRKYIEKDDAFKRRFDTIEVEEPDEEKAVRMLQALAPAYGEHHQLTLTPGALREAVHLATRYLKDRQLPDAAIDLIDRTAAAVRMMVETSGDEVARYRQRLTELTETGTEQDPDLYLAELKWFESELRDAVSPILLGKVPDLLDVGGMERSEDLIAYLHRLLDSLDGHAESDKDSILSGDVAALVAYAKGIPIGKIQSDEKQKLDTMAQRLGERVIGQDQAIQSVVSAVKVSRAGIADAGRPVGSFFFLGPTGTGKTELAKALADFLFNDESALIRFDMSEYTQQHAADTLTGAPPGYVGYEEGGILVNRIRRQPYSVVLFDEIEKAHPEVFKVFLQVLDDGKLTDKQGKVGDFTNAIILFTSNIGHEYIVDSFERGDIPTSAQLTEHMSRHFKDEFLGRLTEIIPFGPITEKNIVKIFRIQARKLGNSLRMKGIDLQMTPEAERHYAMLGFSPRFGARPLRRVILNDLQKPISRLIISGELADGQQLRIDLDEAGEARFNIQ